MSISSRNSLDLEEDMTLLANEKAYATGKRQKRRLFVVVAQYSILAMSIASYAFFFHAYVKTKGDICFLPAHGGEAVNELERIYSDAPLDTKTRDFEEYTLRPYFNYPDDPRAAQDLDIWHHDLSASLSGKYTGLNQFFSKLPYNHAPANSGTFQKILRDLIWDLYVEKTQDYDKTAHADHCIGYFRQHVLCHSDLTPIYFQWDGKTNSYRTDPHPTHSCRSWDAIWKWSAERNKTGMRVHADHVKVFKEFQALHGTDMHSGHHAGNSD
ncbi:hypothetical protein EDB80DRAFT_684376 [Ilyonectria destructans]|nr:hypothetical protein EDB80DRAFT_684376 [Ilyonectria destructans]